MSEYDIMDDLGWYDDSMPLVAVEPVAAELDSVDMPAKIEYDLDDVSVAAFKQSDLEYQYITRVVDGTKFDKFYGYRTHEARNSHGIELLHQGLEIHERVRGQSNFKLFLDIDDKTMMCDEALDEIIRVTDEITLCPIHVCRSDRKNKRSLHIVCDVYCSGMKAYQLFLQHMKAALLDGPYPEAASAIDTIKSSGSFGLRTPLCFKNGTTDTQLTITTDSTFEDFWLQREDYKYSVHEDYNIQEVAAVKRVTHQLLTNDETLATFINEVDGRFAFDIDHLDLQGKQTQTVKRIAPSYCTACQRKHSNRDAFVAFGPTGTMVLRCSIEGKSPHLHMTLNESKTLPEPIIEIEEVPVVKPIHVHVNDEFDQLGASELDESVEVINSRYISDALVDDTEKDLYLSAECKSGKSHYYKQVVDAERAKDPNAVMLAVSSRRSLSAQICTQLGFKSYQDIVGRIDTKKDPALCIQVESLKRIDSKLKLNYLLSMNLLNFVLTYTVPIRPLMHKMVCRHYTS
jgi:hypothetical protein